MAELAGGLRELLQGEVSLELTPHELLRVGFGNRPRNTANARAPARRVITRTLSWRACRRISARQASASAPSDELT